MNWWEPSLSIVKTDLGPTQVDAFDIALRCLQELPMELSTLKAVQKQAANGEFNVDFHLIFST